MYLKKKKNQNELLTQPIKILMLLYINIELLYTSALKLINLVKNAVKLLFFYKFIYKLAFQYKIGAGYLGLK